MRRLLQIALGFLLIVTLLSPCLFAQLAYYKGNRSYRYSNVMSGNKVRTIFYNYGLAGDIGEISGEWPIGTGNEYVGDVSPLVAVEFVHPRGDTLHSVITSDGPRGNGDGQGINFWGFEPLPGFAAEPIGEDPGRVAVSNQPNTWPDFWPDKMYVDPRDPEWERDEYDPGWPGSWNGYFGKNQFNADQEAYFQMDDNADNEWFARIDTAGVYHYFYPDSTDTTRRGCGLRVLVRALQWSHFLAEDCIFWLYEITNVGTTPFDKVAFGMVVGTLSGGREDSRDDLAWFDTQNDITYSWDSDDVGSPGWVCGDLQCVGYVGYAFLESPGNPFDGIDNDGDSPDPSSPVLSSNILYDMTQPTSFEPGDDLILINYHTYERQDTTFPDPGPLVYYVRDKQHRLYAGQQVVENPRNGIDDNFNGLIDERMPDHVDLKYVDYFTGRGLSDLLIDESRNDTIDNDGDWDPFTDDVGADGARLTGDEGEGDGIPTPGEPHFDRTDVDESDQIGLSSFEYFSPPGAVRMNDDDGLWERMKPGRFDSTVSQPEDGDFVYGSGYFPLPPGQTERFSMALLFGEDLADITDNKATVQQIYNENYNFARPPEKATVSAVPGDGQVTLYWDDVAEESYDPTTGFDFEGYKIYRATDPGFNEVFTITDGRGRKIFSRPIAQFDLNNGNSGFFPTAINGASFFLGDDSGIRHVWTDTTAENGQTYYYAVCAYDHGDVEKNIFPAETSKFILLDEGGNLTTDINTIQVTPRAPAAGYTPPNIERVRHITGRSLGSIYVEVFDPREIKDGHEYAVTFDDSGSGAYAYNVIDLSVTPEPDTVLWHEPFVAGPIEDWIYDTFAPYYDSLLGYPPGVYSVEQYFRIQESALFHGQRLYFLTPRQTISVPELSGWVDTSATAEHLLNFTFRVANYPDVFLQGIPWVADYEIAFSDQIIDTAKYFNWYNLFVLPERPTYFTVRNLNRNEQVAFAFQEKDSTRNGRVDAPEVILIFEEDSILTWAAAFLSNAEHNLKPRPGDTLRVFLYQPFTSADRYGYTTSGAKISDAAVQLDRIRVYPNPYLATSTQEPANPYSSGRGPRQVTFIHLPKDCTIRIYTVRGDLVRTIHHNVGIDEGTEQWDLRSKDGLDVAYGVYIYHIESPWGETTGKFALIK
ncbi:hypothetical protein KKB28_00910 [bacterium]|nr:hypothetical protein [bacterium]